MLHQVSSKSTSFKEERTSQNHPCLWSKAMHRMAPLFTSAPPLFSQQQPLFHLLPSGQQKKIAVTSPSPGSVLIVYNDIICPAWFHSTPAASLGCIECNSDANGWMPVDHELKYYPMVQSSGSYRLPQSDIVHRSGDLHSPVQVQ